MNKKEKIALLEHIKKDLEKAIYPPTFEYDINYYIGNDTTQNFFDFKSEFNCYAYAMQFKEKIDPSEKDIYYYPGFLSIGEPFIWTENTIMDGFYKDCDILGIEHIPSNLDEEINTDSYKIAIMIERKIGMLKGFHFIRQNKNGVWSEKRGYFGSVEKVSSPSKVERYDIIDVVKVKRKI